MLPIRASSARKFVAGNASINLKFKDPNPAIAPAKAAKIVEEKTEAAEPIKAPAQEEALPPTEVTPVAAPVENTTSAPPTTTTAAEDKPPITEEVTTDLTVQKVGRKKKKKKLNPGAKVTRLGVGIGVLALGLIVGGYFAFFSGGGSSDTTKGVATQTPNKQASPVDPKGNPPKTDPKKSTAETKKEPKAGEAVRPKPVLIADGRPISNLLPEDSQWVLSVTKEANKTPIFAVMLEPTGAGKVFEKWMGFKAENIEEVVMSGGLESAWVFAVIRLTEPLDIAALQKAMDLVPKQTILKRDYYRIKANDLLKVVGEYLASEIRSQGLQIPMVDPSETMALHLLDSQTLVIAHTAALQKFLNADTKRLEQTLYIHNVPPANPPDAKLPKGGPAVMPPNGKKGPPAKPMGGNVKTPPDEKPASAPPSEPGVERRAVSHDPTYLTVDPALKIMINQLELENRPMVNFAVKIDNLARLGAGILIRVSQQVEKIPATVVPKSPVLGVRVQTFNNRKLSLSAGLQLDTLEQAKFWLEPLNFQVPKIADFFSNLIGVKITATKPDAKGLGADVKDPFLNLNTKLGSFFWTTRQDRMITASLHVDWTAVYDHLINPNLRFQVDLLKGKALMSTGMAYWAKLAPAIKKIEEADRLIPQGDTR